MYSLLLTSLYDKLVHVLLQYIGHVVYIKAFCRLTLSCYSNKILRQSSNFTEKLKLETVR